MSNYYDAPQLFLSAILLFKKGEKLILFSLYRAKMMTDKAKRGYTFLYPQSGALWHIGYGL